VKRTLCIFLFFCLLAGGWILPARGTDPDGFAPSVTLTVPKSETLEQNSAYSIEHTINPNAFGLNAILTMPQSETLAQTSSDQIGSPNSALNNSLSINQSSTYSLFVGNSFALGPISLSQSSTYLNQLPAGVFASNDLPSVSNYSGGMGSYTFAIGPLSLSPSSGYIGNSSRSFSLLLPISVLASIPVATIVGDVWRTAITPKQRILPLSQEIRRLGMNAETRILTPEENRTFNLTPQSRMLVVQP
jgi:hypothetical protein